ncbi:hypothetical protein KSP40_PGU020052 [Platanthera guangdongensis]|uniref:Replication factor-A protein 1 N-terminal domain-containing protein n=1 Tax=Platanthera guangdongensis TaxID=2320717 RepID=A0ABR2LY05_9ASPA
MAARLTPNGIAAVNAGDLDLKPVVQVMDITKVAGSPERFRILVSDGSTTQDALLATQLSDVPGLEDYAGDQLFSCWSTFVALFRAGGQPARLQVTLQQSSLLIIRLQSTIATWRLRRTRLPLESSQSPLSTLSRGWAIKARATAKGELRRYNNARGDERSSPSIFSTPAAARSEPPASMLPRLLPCVHAFPPAKIAETGRSPLRSNFVHASTGAPDIFRKTLATVAAAAACRHAPLAASCCRVPPPLPSRFRLPRAVTAVLAVISQKPPAAYPPLPAYPAACRTVSCRSSPNFISPAPSSVSLISSAAPSFSADRTADLRTPRTADIRAARTALATARQ